MAEKGMLAGIKPVFDGAIDLEATDSAAKILVLAYLGYQNVSGKFNYAYPYKLIDWDFPEIQFERESHYPIKFPFLASTVTDNWDRHKQEIPDKVFVRFLHTDWQNATSSKNRAREEIRRYGYDPDRVVFHPIVDIEEEIGEFISLFYFRHLGFITTVGAPKTGVKAPDVTCWKTPLLRKLRESGLVENGATLMELTMLRLFGKLKSSVRDSNADSSESIVIEVEPSRSRASGGIQQLLGKSVGYGAQEAGYISGGNYDKGFIVAPDCPDDDRVGILSFTENGLRYQDCSKIYSDTQQKALSIREMDDVFKMALLSNLTFDEIMGLIPDIRGRTFHEVMNQITQTDADRIIQQLLRVISR